MIVTSASLAVGRCYRTVSGKAVKIGVFDGSPSSIWSSATAFARYGLTFAKEVVSEIFP